MHLPRAPRASVGTALVLMAAGGVLAFAVDPPATVSRYVDLLDVGLILLWCGLLLLAVQVVLHRPPRTARRRTAPAQRTDQWFEHDVHRPGYADQTRQLPTVRRGRR